MKNIYRILICYLLLSIKISAISAKRSKSYHSATSKSHAKNKLKSSSRSHDIKTTSRKKKKGNKMKEESSDIIETDNDEQRNNERSKIIGTRITGAGHRNKRNRSIYKVAAEGCANASPLSVSAIMGDITPSTDIDNSLFSNKKRTNNPVKGRMYTRLTSDGELLFYFREQDKIISLVSKSLSEGTENREEENQDPIIVATKIEHEERQENNKVDLYSKEWIPIEGIYGIYMLPSGPHLVLITDSEETYKIDGPNSQGNIPQSLINIRRVLSMELVRIPSANGLKKYRYNEEKRQFSLLRSSLKEHEFYYTVPTNAKQTKSCSNILIQDVTHTLQRSFVHWANQQEFLVEKGRHDEAFIQGQNNADGSGDVEVDALVNTTSLNSTGNDNTEKCKQSAIINASAIDESCPVIDISDGNTSAADTGADTNSKYSWASSFFGFGNPSNSVIMDEPQITENEQNLVDIPSSKNERTAFGRASIPTKHDCSSWWFTMLQKEWITADHTFQKPDSRFFWNEENILPFLRSFEAENQSDVTPFQILLDHTIPVSSAFVGIQRDIALAPNTTGAAFSVKYDQLLISRRSKYRAGTRFTKRGADGIGDVANFAETEQICVVKNEAAVCEDSSIQEIYSHIQTRGSIPLRWSSPTDIKTYRPKVMIGTNPLSQARALRNHLVEQLSLYSTSFDVSKRSEHATIAFVNLIDKHSDQGRLGRTFDAVLNAVLETYNGEITEDGLSPSLLNKSCISHIWFDFHAECRKGRWDRLSYLLEDVRPCLDNHGYFCVIPDTKSVWKIIKLQDGVVRTNCMDCLDRTNVVQSMFGRYILFRQFGDRLGLKSAAKRHLPLGYNIAFKRKMLTLPWNTGEIAHRLLWADNADSISRLYAGTNALKGDFTRTGKRTKRGALDDGVNSLTRFYLNNFLDADRQEGMDLLTGFAKFDTEISHTLSSNKRFRSFFHRQKLHDARFKSRLSLSWLPGDLQSHLRSASVSGISTQNDRKSWPKESSELSLSLALRDIDRRAMLEEPWWVTEGTAKRKQRIDGAVTKKQVAAIRSSSTGHVFGALVASFKAPMTTAMAYICLMIPGLFVNE